MALLSTLRLDASLFTSQPLLALTGILFTALIARWVFNNSAESSSNEPPALRPKIPFIGHLMGLMTEGSAFFMSISNCNLPAATLPILNGKIYTILDPQVMQGVFRNRTLTVDPYMRKFLKAEVAYPDKYENMVQTSSLLDDTVKILHEAMAAHHVSRMNTTALRYLGGVLDDMPSELEVPNVWLWVREQLTVATCEALFGSHNPFKEQSSLVEDIWTFDAKLHYFLLGLLPSITAPASYKARARIQAALNEYYGQKHDQNADVSEMIRGLAKLLRELDVSSTDIGYFELSMLHVSVTNSIPVAYWFFCEVFSRPELVEELRSEGLAAVDRDGNTATINVDVLTEKCPLLYSAYRETIRVTNRAPISRRVTEDTIITNGKGLSYGLKGETDLMCSMGVLHTDEKVWGPDARQFDAARFQRMDDGPASEAKAKRAAFAPFGGGKHLCPGRKFAQAEILGLTLALVMGYDVLPAKGEDWSSIALPEKQSLSLGQALHKPVNGGEGFGVRIVRRPEWKSVQWKFNSGSAAAK